MTDMKDKRTKPSDFLDRLNSQQIVNQTSALEDHDNRAFFFSRLNIDFIRQNRYYTECSENKVSGLCAELRYMTSLRSVVSAIS